MFQNLCTSGTKMGKTSADFVDISKMSGEDLKEYLLSDFGDHKYRRKSIIEIHFYDLTYFNSLKKAGKIRQEAIEFFKKEESALRNAEEISVDAFRNLKYEEIVSNYVKDMLRSTDGLSKEKSGREDSQGTGASMAKIQTTTVPGATESQAQRLPDGLPSNNKSISKTLPQKTGEKRAPERTRFHCIKDGRQLLKLDQKKVVFKPSTQQIIMPRYYCPACTRLYTSIPNRKDGNIFVLQGKRYTNIRPAADEARYEVFLKTPHPLESGSKCYVYGRINNKPKECWICKAPLRKRYVSTGKAVYASMFCPDCDVHYLRFTIYESHKKHWRMLNYKDYQQLQDEYKKQQKEKAERKVREQAEDLALAEKSRLQAERRRQQEEIRRQRELARQQRKELMLREQRKLLQQEVQKQTPSVKQPKTAVSRKVDDNRIGVKDFVVRRTIFRCMNAGHNLQNIEGIIEIINNKGNIIQTTVPAGYCPSCKIFFIMESTYQRLKMKGTPMCRISDEKAYMKSDVYTNGMQLAPESVLMQYGYTVSQQEDLSESRRQKILAVLLDYKILTKTEIISYLDFFINQRKTQHKYEKAIVKWENDREFVSEYKKGAYTQYGVSGIHRKY